MPLKFILCLSTLFICLSSFAQGGGYDGQMRFWPSPQVSSEALDILNAVADTEGRTVHGAEAVALFETVLRAGHYMLKSAEQITEEPSFLRFYVEPLLGSGVMSIWLYSGPLKYGPSEKGHFVIPEGRDAELAGAGYFSQFRTSVSRVGGQFLVYMTIDQSPKERTQVLVTVGEADGGLKQLVIDGRLPKVMGQRARTPYMRRGFRFCTSRPAGLKPANCMWLWQNFTPQG